jgi:hypothetical protein
MCLNLEHSKFYKNSMQKCGISAEGAGWKNSEAQMWRFEQMVKVIKDKSCFSINDIGCGFGCLCQYLQNKEYTDFKYVGYDISDVMIKSALKLCTENDNCCFLKTDIKYNTVMVSDYCVASGIFNLKGEDINETSWLKYILDTLEMFNKKSKLGFSFNMLTKYSDIEYMKKELYYADPCFFFDYCKRNYSRNVALLHDYDEYDFTIIVRKDL